MQATQSCWEAGPSTDTRIAPARSAMPQGAHRKAAKAGPKRPRAAAGGAALRLHALHALAPLCGHARRGLAEVPPLVGAPLLSGRAARHMRPQSTQQRASPAPCRRMARRRCRGPGSPARRAGAASLGPSASHTLWTPPGTSWQPRRHPVAGHGRAAAARQHGSAVGAGVAGRREAATPGPCDSAAPLQRNCAWPPCSRGARCGAASSPLGPASSQTTSHTPRRARRTLFVSGWYCLASL